MRGALFFFFCRSPSFSLFLLLVICLIFFSLLRRVLHLLHTRFALLLRVFLPSTTPLSCVGQHTQPSPFIEFTDLQISANDYLAFLLVSVVGLHLSRVTPIMCGPCEAYAYSMTPSQMKFSTGFVWELRCCCQNERPSWDTATSSSHVPPLLPLVTQNLSKR